MIHQGNLFQYYFFQLNRLKIPHYDWQNRDFFIKPLREINCQAEEFKNLKFA